MLDFFISLLNNSNQCWTCPIFDSLFVIISKASAAAYNNLRFICVIIFCILLGFYIVNIVWQNIKKSGDDVMFQKTLIPTLIKSLLVLTLLFLGLNVPKLISAITFEPVALLTLKFSQLLLPTDFIVQSSYTPIQLDDTGFFNPTLRDTILKIIETNVSNFQVFISIGLSIIEKSFSKILLVGIGQIINHIIVCFIGIYLTYKFTKLFIKYSFCFMDIIIRMAMFGFMFPLSLILFIFKDANNTPSWMKNLGKNLGGGQIKKLINAIVSLTSAVFTYTIISLIIRGFLDLNEMDTSSFQLATDDLYNFDLESSYSMQLTMLGAIVLVHIIDYMAGQIPKITEKIMSAFGVSQENKLSDEMGENVLTLTSIVKDEAKKIAKTIINPSETTETEKKK